MTTGDGDARLEQAQQLLADAVRQLVTADDWCAVLQAAGRFHRYSARNILLLLAQGATGRVAGYRTWQQISAQDGGQCQVRKGARGLTILAPTRRPTWVTDPVSGERSQLWLLTGFRTASVFDEASLVSPPAMQLPGPTLLKADAPSAARARLVELLEAEGFPVMEADIAPAWGRTTWKPRSVAIRSGQSPADELMTLAHEAGHVLLHNPSDPDRPTSRQRCEVEAESVAFVVAQHVGVNAMGFSAPYIAHWSPAEPDAVLRCADRVLGAARRITDAVSPTLELVRDGPSSAALHPVEAHALARSGSASVRRPPSR